MVHTKLTEEQWKPRVPRVIAHYKEMEEFDRASAYKSGMLAEVKWQYADMANGGDGGEIGFEENGQTTCRGINYPGYPDEFFKEVCALMLWEY